MNSIIVFIIIGYVSVLFQKAIVLNVSNTQWTIKKLIFTATSIYLPHVIVFNFFISNNTFFVLGSVLIWLSLLTLAYRLSFKQPLLKSIFMAVGQYFFLGAGFNYIIRFIITLLPEYARNFTLENLFVSRIFTTLIFMLIFVYTKKLANKGHALNHLFAKYWVFYLAFFLFFAAFDAIHIIGLADVQTVNNLTTVFTVTLFFVLFLHSILHIKTFHKLELTQRELESQQLYSASQQNLLDTLRGFKHDFRNIINAMNGLLENEELTKLKLYIEDINEQIKSPQTLEVSAIIKKIPILSGILAEKIGRAELKGITFEVIIEEDDIDLKYCSDLDYSRMISNLLDNAIEAAEASKQKTISFTISVENGKLHNVIKNSCDYEVDAVRIFEHGYSTKLNSSGEGLHQIRLIQDKYRKMGYSIEIMPISKDGYFIQVLNL
ncbi:MAG: GHKL domain-containing protein [Defluviitaleaceae bacterium]|nr:GHKL domain-containing protein [Defluviitaleaceae bacterium]